MLSAVILCPWVVPMAPFGQELSPQLLGEVNFEFESSASAEEMQVAGVMRARLAQASAPLAAHGSPYNCPYDRTHGCRAYGTGLWANR